MVICVDFLLFFWDRWNFYLLTDLILAGTHALTIGVVCSTYFYIRISCNIEQKNPPEIDLSAEWKINKILLRYDRDWLFLPVVIMVSWA